MSKELRELHDAIAHYALEHSVGEIPQLYFDRTVKTWNKMNLDDQGWDKTKAAAALLHAAVTSGLIHQSQMTPQGYRALNWAENFYRKFEAAAA